MEIEELATQVRAVVEKRTSLSTSVLYREMSAGRFPRPIRKSPGRVAWLKSDVDAWLAARVAERDAEIAARSKSAARVKRTATLLAGVAS